MQKTTICDGIEAICSVHWDRRLFDSLIPLPDGTSYNAYIVRGSKGVALIDTADPELREEFMQNIATLDRVDYIVSQHTEQDHSGLLPELLERFPNAPLLCTDKARDLLITHLAIPEARIRVVADGESVSLGDKTLVFVYTPWVHWPETMCTFVPESKCLFSCDFFGSHLAASDAFVTDPARVYEAAKRYYAEIMMPFRKIIVKNLEKLEKLDFDMIAPSHGPVYNDAQFILDAYHEWVGPTVKNEVVIPYISMHGSTAKMVKHLTDALAARGVRVQLFNLEVTDIGKLAMALVDAATLVVATPTVHVGPHPLVYYAAHLANVLRPKLKYAAVIGSYGWSSKAVEQVAGQIPSLKVDILGTLMQKGLPTDDTFKELDALAEKIAAAHASDKDVVK